MISCLRCIIKNCENIHTSRSGFCYECTKYPCRRLKALDKRYRTKYGMSMIENLENLNRDGLDAFVEAENERWRCRTCGGVICVHRARCPGCGADRPSMTLESST
jgi:rubrerythrin